MVLIFCKLQFNWAILCPAFPTDSSNLWSAYMFGWMFIKEFLLVLQHLLFSVTEPQYRVKPVGVSDVSLVLSLWLVYLYSLFHYKLISQGDFVSPI